MRKQYIQKADGDKELPLACNCGGRYFVHGAASAGGFAVIGFSARDHKYVCQSCGRVYDFVIELKEAV